MLQDQGEVSRRIFLRQTDSEWEEIYKFWKSGSVDIQKKSENK